MLRGRRETQKPRMSDLHWLPEIPDWRQRLRALPADPGTAWDNAIALANARLNFVLTNALDETIRRILPDGPERRHTTKVRLAVLGSSTLTHLLPGIRAAGLRRGIWIDTYENDYGQYLQELSEPGSSLHQFKPTAVLMALDAYHLTAGVTSGMDAETADAALIEMQDRIKEVWNLARQTFSCPIIQQAVLPLHFPVLGNNEHRLPGSRAWFVTRLNAAIRGMAEQEGVDILAVDDRAARDGIGKWHDTALWHRSKQEVSPDRRPDVWRSGRTVAGSQARPVVQMPRAGSGQHHLGRRHRRRRAGGYRPRPGQPAWRGLYRLSGICPRVEPPWRHPGGVLQER